MALAEMNLDVDPRVQFFVEINEQQKATGKKMPWSERVELIYEHFPSVRHPDWNAVLRDIDIMGEFIRDILRLDQAEPGKSGPRPAPEVKKGIRTIRQMAGDDFSISPFPEAFRILARGYSIRHLARKVSLSRMQVHRLLHAEVTPTPYEMRVIAEAFSKSPAYFLEFRSAYIMACLGAKLDSLPEASIGLYRKIVAQ